MLHQNIFKKCSLWQYVKGFRNKLHTAVRRNLEEIIEVRTFLKMSKGFKSWGPRVEPQFCLFLECVDFSTTGTNTEQKNS